MLVPVPLEGTVTSTSALLVGDFDGDGHADLAVVDSSPFAGPAATESDPGGIELLRGVGDGTLRYAALMPITIQSDYRANVVAGDFNGDGRSDLAIAGFDPQQFRAGLVIFQGVSGGSFHARAPIALAVDPFSVVMGDFNADGRADLAVYGSDFSGSTGTPAVEILLGAGNGIFGSQIDGRHSAGGRLGGDG